MSTPLVMWEKKNWFYTAFVISKKLLNYIKVGWRWSHGSIISAIGCGLKSEET